MSTLTPSQQQAINATGNVLVVAGAGTGKTSTLIARCQRLMLEAGCSLEELLIVTFTEAAAAELRQRLREALTDALTRTPTAPLAEQLALLDTAHISTLHGFCRHLVAAHFDELGIDPEVAVLDDQQTQPLIQETLDTLMARCFDAAAPQTQAVPELIRLQGRGSTDAIRGWIVLIHRYTQSLPDPDAWFERQRAHFREPEPRPWRQWLVEAVRDWANRWLPVLAAQAGDCAFARLSVGWLEEVLADARSSEAAVGQTAESFAPLRTMLDGLFTQLIEADQGTEHWPNRRKGEFRKPLKKFFDELDFLRTQTALTPDGQDPLAQDWQWVAPSMITLLELARDFTHRFSAAKRELGGVDFADLEQFALRLLRDPAGQPTVIARHWRAQFRHVFVDEYQDINPAQDAILSALGREGAEANRFLVGDVKQSIYRFRRANPRIFQNYERLWRQDATAGTRIPLSDNFRSREGLLAFVNDLFGALMRPAIGGLTYDADARLQFGNRTGRAALALTAVVDAATEGAVPVTPAASPEPRVELHLLTQAQAELPSTEDAEDHGEDDGDKSPLVDLLAAEKEARLIALRLRELKQQGHRYWNAKTHEFEPVDYRQMVVLLRSPKGKVEAYAKEFHRVGVPLLAPRGGFFEALEVMDLLNLLKLLDNPFQDIPLLAVLRSPLVGLDLDDLVAIRTAGEAKPFWRALQEFAELAVASPAADTRAKAKAFLDQFAGWRELTRQSSLSYCLETALADTHYEALLLAGERGAERAANVRRFVDLARQYDPFQRQGLFRFLRFIAAQQAADVEWEPAPVPESNAVQLMSIHKSKGLEFPVVVVGDLGKTFNLGANRDDLLLDEHFGLCPRVAPPEAGRYSSLPHWLARQRERTESLGEELRLLYVAMTRARDTLILTGTIRARQDAGRWESTGPVPLPDQAILNANSALAWLRLWLPQATQPEDWRDGGTGQNARLRWRLYADQDPALRLPGDVGEGAADAPSPLLTLDGATLATIQQRVQWRYPAPAATAQAAKQSVTALARSRRDEDDEAESWMAHGGVDFLFRITRPARDAERLAAAEVGTAHHQFLQYVALDRVEHPSALRAEAERLEHAGLLSAAQVAALSFEALAAFWASDCGQRIRTQAEYVRREVPFTARMTPDELSAAGLPLVDALPVEEFLVVQGVVDLAVIQRGEIWILDYKTDAVPPGGVAEKKAAYQPQLALYARALSKIYRRPVTRQWLHFLALGRTESLIVEPN